MVRIPATFRLPETEEAFVLHEPFASFFETLADGANHLAGFQFLRAVPVIVSPFNTSGPFDVFAEIAVDPLTKRYIRFTTSSLAAYLFVAFGYSRILAPGGYVKAGVRVAHATIPGNGAVYDPGFYAYRANGDLPNPINGRRYSPEGLQWVTSGFTDPPSVDPGDPVALRPRVLRCESLTDIDLAVEWEDVKVNAIYIAELWRPNI